MRNPMEKFFDGWGHMDMWNRFGVSFIGAIALLCGILTILGG